MTVHIAVDIGGTQLRAASYVAGSMTPFHVERIQTQHPQETVLERLQKLIESVWPAEDTVAGIGVAAPGPTDPFRGIVIETPNIPGWDGLPLRDYLQNHFHVPVGLGNDANLAALGEWKYGAGKGHHHLIYITVSTGIGSGVIINDELLLGARGLAGEIGHITITENGPKCGCGGYGHLEAVASGTAIARWVEEQLREGAESILKTQRPVSARLVAQAAKEGDPLATTALARAGEYLGIALASLLHIFNPTVIVIGGGVSRSGALFLEPTRTALTNHVMNPGFLEDLAFKIAAFGDDAGLMGALAYARTLFQE